jgi:hypothetical protein
MAEAIDYEALARKLGGSAVPQQPAPAAPQGDYGEMARQFGGQLAPIQPELESGLRMPEPTTSERILQAPERTARAFPGSFRNLIRDTLQAITSPLETAKGVMDIGAGALRNVTPAALRGLLDQVDRDPQAAEKASQIARQAGAYYADRYGSPAAIAETLQTDPAGALADLSTLLVGGAGAVRAAGAAAVAARAPVAGAALERAGGAMGRAAELVNPLSPPVRAINVMRQVPSSFTMRPEARAGRIVQEAIGPERFALEDAMKAYPGMTPMEAAAQAGIVRPPGIERSQFYALGQAAEALDTENFFAKLARQQQREDLNALSQIAGGQTQTQARQAQKAAKEGIEAELGPVRETEIGAANIAGQLEPRLAARQAQMERGAAAKVEDVRRFTAAGERAEARAGQTFPVEGQVRAPGRYTYMGDLAKKAEKMAADAAKGSLDFGEAARFAKAAKESLAAHELRPLRADEINAKIDDILREPKYAGDRDVAQGMLRVKEDIAQWTDNNGVIDGHALESIRKNSINSAIGQLVGQGADSKRGRKLAAKLLSELRPIIVDAMERAGGTGYGDYLRQYSLGLHSVSQRKAAAGLMKMYRDNPKRFQAMVSGEDPKAVEKIFGPNSYDIAVEMAPYMPQLEKMSQRLTRLEDIKGQAAKGQDAINLILEDNRDYLKFPPWLNAKVAFTNEVIRRLEGYTNKETRLALEKAFQSSTNMTDLMSKVPYEQQGVLRRAAGNAASLLFSADLTRKGVSAPKVGAAARVQNMLMQDQEQSENALME